MEEVSTRVFICAVIQNSNEDFLLLKRANNSRFAAGKWEFLSGTMEEGETAEECIIREANEETGLKVTSLKSLTPFEFTDFDGRWIVIPFEAEVDLVDIDLSNEHSDFGWFNRGEMLSIKEMQDLKDLWQ